MTLLLCGILNMTRMSRSTKYKQNQGRYENRTLVAKVGDGRVMGWKLISRCKLGYTGWMSRRVLPYSTGNCVQYPMINHHEKSMKKNT